MRKAKSLPVGSDDVSEINYPLGVAPLVVVPGNNLHHVIAHHHGERGIDG